MFFSFFKTNHLFEVLIVLAVASSSGLAQSLTVKGHVKAEKGYTPVEVKVVLNDRNNPEYRRFAESVDISNGEFEIKNVQQGTYDVVACAGTTFAPTQIKLEVLAGKVPPADLTLILANVHKRIRANVPNRPGMTVTALAYGCAVASLITTNQLPYFDQLPIPPQKYQFEAVLPDGRRFTSALVTVPSSSQEAIVELSFDGSLGFETRLLAQMRTRFGLSFAIRALNAQVDKTPHLFSAPGPRLQTELFTSYQTNQTAKEVISTLSENQTQLPKATLERAALLAFALEDYRVAAGFVDVGLKASPGNEKLLATRGLIQYEQSLYPQALATLQQATALPGTNPNFRGALMGNLGLVKWGLGQTDNAETLLSNSLPLFNGEDAKQQQAYLLLKQADSYIDYGQPLKAQEALRLVSASGLDKQSSVVDGQVHRLKARVALFRGVISEASQEIEKAVSLHQSTSNSLELAQDKDVQADIEELTGLHKEALKTLAEAAAKYETSSYLKGRAENQWKRANVLLALNEFNGSEKLLAEASKNFTQLNYRRGLGDCEALRGLLALRRANHQYLLRFDPNMTPQEKEAANQEFRNQAQAGIERFEKAIRIFQEIGYKRGVANAQNKLAINIISLSEEPSAEDFSRAEFSGKEAVRTFAEIDDKRGQVEAHGNLGIVYRKYKQYEFAQSNLERALEISKSIGFKLGIGRQLFNLGRLFYEKGFGKSEQDLLKAREYFLDAQSVFRATQAGQDELKAIDEYLKNLSTILR